jgi:SAM-dependent methyltransferase
MPERAGPDPYADSFTGLVVARTLTTAVLLGVFDAVHERPARADELADRLGLDPLGMATLLSTLTALGYLAVDGDILRNTPVSEEQLVCSAPRSIASFVGGLADLHWQVLTRLPEAVRDGSAYAMHEGLNGGPDRWDAYLRGLHEMFRSEQDSTAALVPVDHPDHLVDVAGGHGGFAMAMCRRHPGVRATVVDLPASTAIGRRIVAEEGFADRVTFRDGDVFEVGLGTGADVVSVFNLIHHLPEERGRRLCRMAHAALRPGGFLAVGDCALPEPDERVSTHGAVSSLLFYAWSHGRNFRPSEVGTWLAEAGFAEIAVHRKPHAPWRMVVVGRAA